MSMKLRAISLGILAAMAISAVAVMNASANGKGHFVFSGHGENLWEVEGTEQEPAHKLELTLHGLEGGVVCDVAFYDATGKGETAADLTFIPTYEKCHTTGSATNIPIHVNGCTYTFTVAEKTGDATEQTAHLKCPVGKTLEITHPNCTVTIHEQSVTTGLTYTTRPVAPETGPHWITLDVNIQFKVTKHGICQILGTEGNGTLKGSATAKAYKHGTPTQINLTAT
jgi:hypothetical protein